MFGGQLFVEYGQVQVQLAKGTVHKVAKVAYERTVFN